MAQPNNCQGKRVATKKNTIFSDIPCVRQQEQYMVICLIITIVCIPVAFTALKYAFYCFRLWWVNAMGYSYNWYKGLGYDELYHRFQEAKRAFIDSNLQARFYSSLNGNMVLKLIQLVTIAATIYLPVFWLKAALGFWTKSCRLYKKAIARKAAQYRAKKSV